MITDEKLLKEQVAKIEQFKKEIISLETKIDDFLKEASNVEVKAAISRSRRKARDLKKEIKEWKNKLKDFKTALVDYLKASLTKKEE